MPVNTPPLQGSLPVAGGGEALWTKPWANWFSQVWLAVFGWKRTYFGSKVHDFGSISAQSQATTTTTVTGARVGDVVIVRPTTAVNGIILDGTVTADNTVTIRALNYSASPINPDEQTYNVVVVQQ